MAGLPLLKWLGRSHTGPRLGGPPAGAVGAAGVPGPPQLTSPSPTVFIYSMPGYKCSIKERMLYSSCKSRLLDSVEQDFQLEIAKKVGAVPSGPVITPYVGCQGPETMAEQGALLPCWMEGETETQGVVCVVDGLDKPQL